MKLYRWLFAALLTLAFVTGSAATVNRQVPNTTTDPSGVAQSTYVDAVSEEMAALWRLGAEPLTSVAGTNTITGTPLVSTTGFAAYETGNKFSFVAAATNTGAVTLNVASRGAKSVKTAAGSALAGGEIVSGTLYLVEYDGTDFRLASGDYDLGAGINGATAKSTPVDADEFALSDSAASNVAKKVTLAELRTVLASGLTLVNEDEPTSDVSEIGETGLSAYRDIKVAFAVYSTSANAGLQIQARSSGGTWRTLAVVGATAAGGQISYFGEITIRSFGRNNNMKIISGVVARHDSGVSLSLDRSDALKYSTVADNSTSSFLEGAQPVAGYSSYTAQWDEFRLTPSTGNWEGSTADQRSYVAYYGEGEGD